MSNGSNGCGAVTRPPSIVPGSGRVPVRGRRRRQRVTRLLLIPTVATVAARSAAGARVVLIDRAEATLETLRSELGPDAIPLVINLTDSASVTGMTAQILQKTGHLDIFHANAGAYVGGKVVDGDSNSWDRMLNLNVNAVFRSIHAVLPHRVERKTGDIIVTSSVAGLIPVV